MLLDNLDVRNHSYKMCETGTIKKIPWVVQDIYSFIHILVSRHKAGDTLGMPTLCRATTLQTLTRCQEEDARYLEKTRGEMQESNLKPLKARGKCAYHLSFYQTIFILKMKYIYNKYTVIKKQIIPHMQQENRRRKEAESRITQCEESDHSLSLHESACAYWEQ